MTKPLTLAEKRTRQRERERERRKRIEASGVKLEKPRPTAKRKPQPKPVRRIPPTALFEMLADLRRGGSAERARRENHVRVRKKG